MSEVQLVVLYPHPTDVEAFNAGYVDHIALLRKNAQIPDGVTPYTLTRFGPGPTGDPAYYQMFTMPFPSAEALQAAFATPEMQEVAADSARLSTGGAPVIMVGGAA